RVEHAGADADPYLLAERALRPELFTCPGGIGGHGFADGLDVLQALAESATAADLLFWLRLVIQIQARHAAQFPGCFLDHHTVPLAQCPGISLEIGRASCRETG